MVPDIFKIDTDRQLDLRLPAWSIYDEALRCLLHGKQSAPSSEDLLIPFVVSNPAATHRYKTLFCRGGTAFKFGAFAPFDP